MGHFCKRDSVPHGPRTSKKAVRAANEGGLNFFVDSWVKDAKMGASG